MIASATLAAFDADEGVVSPGGVGYDINCGVRLLGSTLQQADVRAKLLELGFEPAPWSPDKTRRFMKDQLALTQKLIDAGIHAMLGHFNSGVTIPASRMASSLTCENSLRLSTILRTRSLMRR